MLFNSHSVAGFRISSKLELSSRRLGRTGVAARAGQGFAVTALDGGGYSVQREHLAGVQRPIGIEDGLDAKLQGEILVAELGTHQVPLLDADTMLARETAAHLDAEPQDLGACFFGFGSLLRLVGVIHDQGMQVAIAGMEDVRNFEAMALADLGDAVEHVR